MIFLKWQMHSITTLSYVSLYLLTLFEIIHTAKICKIVNGGAGTCLSLEKCRPISDLYNKPHKTDDEKLFIRQINCGDNSSSKVKVCCPPVSEWRNFVAIPVKYPTHTEPPPIKPPLVGSGIKPASPKPSIAPVTGSQPVTTKPSVEIEDRNIFNDGKIISLEKGICGDDFSSANKITGGEATSVDQYPWLALLEYSGGFLGCGGSLISARFVLTAAHCVDGLSGVPQRVRLSEYNTTSYPIDYVQVDGGGYENVTVTIINVANAVAHPAFNRDLKIHDIGMIKLAQKAIFSDFIKIICLPAKDYSYIFTTKTNFTVAGWGDTEDINDPFKDVKKDVSVPFVPPETCKKVRPDIAPNSQICAGGEKGKDSCKGDSGGPLMYVIDHQYLIVGITSYGHRICGTEGIPAVYTNVFAHQDWIMDILTGKIII